MNANNSETSIPLVSIIIPTHNSARYIKKTIASVLAQTSQDWELLCVDDGSADNTVEIIREFEDPRISLLLQPHTGDPGRVRNVGINASRGKYVAFLDSDDSWLPVKLAAQVAALENEPEVGVALCSYRIYYEATGHCSRQIFPRLNLPDGPFDAFEFLLIDGLAPTSAMLVRRGILLEVGGFDENREHYLAEDNCLRLLLSRKTSFIFLHDPLLLYTFRADSLSRQESEAAKSIMQVIKNEIENLPLDRRAALRLDIIYANLSGQLALAYILEGERQKALKELWIAARHRVSVSLLIFLVLAVLPQGGINRLRYLRYRYG